MRPMFSLWAVALVAGCGSGTPDPAKSPHVAAPAPTTSAGGYIVRSDPPKLTTEQELARSLGEIMNKVPTEAELPMTIYPRVMLVPDVPKERTALADQLAARLSDHDPKVRKAAIVLVGEITLAAQKAVLTAKPVGTLKPTLIDKFNEEMQSASQKKMSKAQPSAEVSRFLSARSRVLDALVARLRDDFDFDCKEHAAMELGNIGPDRLLDWTDVKSAFYGQSPFSESEDSVCLALLHTKNSSSLTTVRKAADQALVNIRKREFLKR